MLANSSVQKITSIQQVFIALFIIDAALYFDLQLVQISCNIPGKVKNMIKLILLVFNTTLENKPVSIKI